MAEYDTRVCRCKYCEMTFTVVVRRCPARRLGPCVWDGKPWRSQDREPAWLARLSAKDFSFVED